MEVRAPVVDESGQRIGELVVSQLPNRSECPGWDGPVAEVAEGGTYRFSVELLAQPAEVILEPSSELFSFDTPSCLTGRLMPRQHVGRIRVEIAVPGTAVVGTTELSVTPTKLEYATEYHYMLEGVASVATEALLQGFSPAALALRQDTASRPSLMYQQFAFLHARLRSRELRNALAVVIASPHRSWQSEAEAVGAGRPLPGSSQLGRALARPGPRVGTNGRLRVRTVPRAIERSRTDATFDSVPNRFVKYALQRWRALAQQLLDRMEQPQLRQTGPLRRGVRAARETITELDHVLATPFFAQVGRLDVFPSANQVLHKQEGYRQVFQTFALAEVGAGLSMDWAIDDAFSASQRNVATLYEYWTFLQLVDVIGEVCGASRTVEALAVAADGLSLGFRQGTKGGVRWETTARDRELEVEVFFNRTFVSSTSRDSETSWSRAMRPDCSVRVRPRTLLPDVEAGALDVWLHFDAKYRVERVREQFDSEMPDAPSAAAEAEAAERVGVSKREDLLKMHAYRDAIRRSAGAYVLFPGDHSAAPFREFAEPLPGLGAFVLRPAEAGSAAGRDALRDFLGDVLEHVADRASQHERDRYWRAIVRSGPPDDAKAGRDFPPLSVPPRDALVVCVTVDPAGFEWIARTGLLVMAAAHNDAHLRPDGDELRADWVILGGADVPPSLWTREGAWWVQQAGDLVALGYPGPLVQAYLATRVVRAPDQLDWLADVDFTYVSAWRGERAGPGCVMTWADLAGG